VVRRIPLHTRIQRVFIAVVLALFPLIALSSGLLEYNRIRDDFSQTMHSRLNVAQAILREELHHVDDLVNSLRHSLATGRGDAYLARLVDARFFTLLGDAFYLLDENGRVIAISKPYQEYLGLDFSSMVSWSGRHERQVRYYQSLLTKKSVVAISYPFAKGRLLVVERPADKFVPIMASFESARRYDGELFFVLCKNGLTVYHPDRELIRTRYNFGFELKQRSAPDKDGFFTFVRNGTKYIGLSTVFADPSDWVMYYCIPSSVLHHELLGRLSTQFLFLGGLLFALLWVLGLAFNRFVNRPVTSLVTSLKQADHTKELSLSDRDLGEIDEFRTIADAILDRDREIVEVFTRFSAVLNSLEAIVYVADMQTHEILFINSYGRNLVGDCTGKLCYLSFQVGMDGPCPFCTNERLVDEEGRPSGPYIWERYNEKIGRWYDCRDQAIEWIDGRIVRLEIATDITERKQSEEALAAEKERLEVTLRSIGDGVITTDVEGRVVYVNKVAEDMTGWQNHEAQGRPATEVFKIINEKTGQLCASPVQRVIELGRIVGLANHTALIARDGTVRSIADSGAPIRDRKGNIIGVVLVFRDISKERKMEEELLKVRKLESVGVLAGGIAHDFNNILAAILGNIELLGYRMGDKDAEAQALLSDIKRAIRRAAKLTRQLLTFSKGGDPVKAATSLPELITESANFVLHGSPVRCRFVFPENLWMADVDSGQLGQVIQNIVLNGVHAMPGGGTITITCANVRDAASESLLSVDRGNYVRISIADTGVGIPREIIDKIFDPYFTTKQEGSGLGLAICHSIINKHDGFLTVESEPGQGTTFTIYLPALPGQDETSFIRPGIPRSTRSARVMVMDDEEMLRKLAASQLTILGHKPILVEDGQEAVNRYQELQDKGTPVDVVILDLTIPGGMGGQEAGEQLLAVDPEARIIVTSGYSNDPVMSSFRKYGFKAAIEKPFNLRELSIAVGTALSS